MAIAIRGGDLCADFLNGFNGLFSGLNDGLFFQDFGVRLREEYHDRDLAYDVVCGLYVSLLVTSGRDRTQAFEDP